MSNKGTRISAGGGVIALLLVLVIAAVTWLTVAGVKGTNPICLFGHSYGDDGKCSRCGEVKPIDKTDGGNVVVETVVSKGMTLNATPVVTSSNEEQSYILTATVLPISADNKRVEWTVEWKNANSTWANGKVVTEYVTVTPTSANALTATVACIQDFGEQVIVTVTSLENAEATAQCTVDYVQKITGFTFHMPDIASATTAFTYDVEYSDYTLAAEVSLDVSDKFILNGFNVDDFYNSLRIDYGVSETAAFASPQAMLTKQENNLVLSFDLEYYEEYLHQADTRDEWTMYAPGLVGCFVRYDKYVCKNPDILTVAFRNKVANIQGQFDLTYSTKYNGKTYSQGTQKINVGFDQSAFYVPVTGMQLSQDNLVF